ncbi:unnamed protein product [Phytophthora fragariaefolia]|uniref:Unnamed protein product n=1 Tax=Phytophthora fragariaefolia TaxID=1490495 RepID=A0A9W7DFK9_9STRA|nr:unnamed protein product [Phytophthora fragariaefolia]
MSSGVWLKSSSKSLSLSPEDLSLSLDSLPAELRGDPLLMLHAPPPEPFAQGGEHRQYGFYGLEPDGALRPGGQVPLFSKRAFGLLLNYVCIGGLYGGLNSAIVPFLSRYLELEQYQVRAASNVINAAWNFKAFGGLLTDSLQICGYRRKPYLVAGWALCLVNLMYLGTTRMPAAGNTGVAWRYVLSMTLGTMGFFLANVAADGILVEIAQREPLLTRGYTHVAIYTARMIGLIIMNVFVGATLNGSAYGGTFSWSMSFNQVMLVMSLCAAVPLVGSIWLLHEDSAVQKVPVFSFSTIVSCPVAPGRLQPALGPFERPLDFAGRCQLIWRLLQSRAMWQLLMFEAVASFCVTMDSTAASAIEANWVDVEAWPKTLATAVWGLGFIGGLLATRSFLLRGSWGHLFCVATFWTVIVDIVTVACTVFHVIRRRSFWLYMQVLAAPAFGLRFMMLVFPIVELAPRGIEATTYGLVITFRNIAIPLGTMAYKAIDSHFSIADEAVHEDSESTRLQVSYTYLIAWAFQLVSLAFVGLLPHQKLEVQQLRYYGGYSTSGGWFVIIVLCGVLTYVTTGNVLSLFKSTSCLRMAGGPGC